MPAPTDAATLAAKSIREAIDAQRERFNAAVKKWEVDKAAAEATGFPFEDSNGMPIERPRESNQLVGIAPPDLLAACEAVPITAVDDMVKSFRRGTLAVRRMDGVWDTGVTAINIRMDQAELLLSKLSKKPTPGPS